MAPRIPFIRPALPSADEIATDLKLMIERNWYSNFGPFERSFREKIEAYLGAEVHAATVNNATTGIMAALAALLPRGTETESIAIASFTFAAGAHAIAWHGYRPLWFDIDPETLQPSRESCTAAIAQANNVRAILLTNTFGIGNAEIAAWESFAAELQIPLVIDSAAGFGSQYPSQELLGARGDCEVFSFHATKPFAIGEGGAVTSRNPELIAAITRFTNFGFGDQRDAEGIGLNGKLQELNAAIGLRQLERYPEVLEARRSVIEFYAREFAETSLTLTPGLPSSSGCFASVVCASSQVAQSALLSLSRADVDARQYYAPAVHTHEWFTRFAPLVSLEHTTDICSRIVSLPVLSDMTAEERERVVAAVRAAVAA